MGTLHPTMRAHHWIVGLGLVVFACQSALAAMFSVSSGSCTLSGDCIRTPNYPGQYSSETGTYYGRRLLQSFYEGNSCIFTALAAGTVSTTAFNTYSSDDYLRIGATYYRGAGSENGPDSNGHDRYPSYSGNSGTTGPSGVSVSSGQQMSWTVDDSGVSTGWELCLTAAAPTPSPTTAGPARMSTTGTCILSGTNGDCVSSPNYPNPYDSTDCTITNNLAGYLTAANFSVYLDEDTLNIRRRGLGAYKSRRRSYATCRDYGAGDNYGPNYCVSSTILNVYLEAGEQIDWTTDHSGSSTGWQICNTAPTSAPTYEPTTPFPTSETLAEDSSETNGGAVAGILIAILVFCVIIPVVCCCFFCGSCPLAKSRNQKTVIHVQQIQPPPVSQPTAPIMHQPIQPPPQAIPMAAQPIAMVAQPMMKQEAPPMAPPPPGQSGVQYGAAPPPPPYQPQGASPAPSAPVAFCASCGAANDSGGAFCASCGAQL